MKPKFAAGARVRVRVAYPVGHNRTPAYIRGKRGIVERICGEFRKPEELAYGRIGERETLYRVRFPLADIWNGYAGAIHDKIDVEVYEHWLEPA